MRRTNADPRRWFDEDPGAFEPVGRRDKGRQADAMSVDTEGFGEKGALADRAVDEIGGMLRAWIDVGHSPYGKCRGRGQTHGNHFRTRLQSCVAPD